MVGSRTPAEKPCGFADHCQAAQSMFGWCVSIGHGHGVHWGSLTSLVLASVRMVEVIETVRL